MTTKATLRGGVFDGREIDLESVSQPDYEAEKIKIAQGTKENPRQISATYQRTEEVVDGRVVFVSKGEDVNE